MNWFTRIFSRAETAENGHPPSGEDESVADEKPKKKNGSSVWCDPEMQRRRDAEVEEAKKKSMESHRDLTQTIEDFVKKKKKRGHSGLEAPRA